jgi:hypothetical protein
MRRLRQHVRLVPTLLRKSVTADGCPSAIRLLTTGFDLPALTLVTQLQRYAIHGAIVGGGRAPSDASTTEILSDASEDKFVLGTSRPAQSEPTKLQDALQVAEPHLDLLRSRRDCSKASVSAKDRATSRACSWTSRGILRNGTFGQHSALSSQPARCPLRPQQRTSSLRPAHCVRMSDIEAVLVRRDRRADGGAGGDGRGLSQVRYRPCLAVAADRLMVARQGALATTDKQNTPPEARWSFRDRASVTI